jgi:NAD-dependent dihydropyrimidine dehydrogenase PreA subunit
MAFHPHVDQKKCSGCEECLETCTAGVLEMRTGKAYPAHTEACVGCGSCAQGCKENALTIEDTRVKLSEQCLALLRDIL